jgi:cell division protein FtsB
MNNALIERIRDRDKEIADLKQTVVELREEIFNLKSDLPLEKLLNEYIDEEIARDEAEELSREESRKSGLNEVIIKNNNPQL